MFLFMCEGNKVGNDCEVCYTCYNIYKDMKNG